MKDNKIIIAIVAIVAITNYTQLFAQETKITDERDGQEYKIMYAGNQIWMAENLNFESENAWGYADKKKNSKHYGKLYTWEAASNACPTGWHLPNAKEWQELINFYGGDLQAGLALRIDGTSAFNSDYAGFRNKNGEFLDLGHDANYWTATNCDDEDAWRCYIDRGSSTVVQDYFSKTGGLSVRCIRGGSSNQEVALKK